MMPVLALELGMISAHRPVVVHDGAVRVRVRFGFGLGIGVWVRGTGREP